jgi:hypothetical protein
MDAAAAAPTQPAGWPESAPVPAAAERHPVTANRAPGIPRRAYRLVGALVAWPPIGIAAAAVIGEATGCAAYEATCAPPAQAYPWFAQAAILLGLLAAPAVARALAGGSIAIALLAFPVVAVLSAGGAAYDRTYGPTALIVVLAVVWAAGVGAVFLRGALTRAIP